MPFIIQSILKPLITKGVRYLIGALSLLLIHWGANGVASFIGSQEPEIVTGLIGLTTAILWDLWAHLSKSVAWAKVKQFMLVPPNASPAQVVEVAERAGAIVQGLTPPGISPRDVLSGQAPQL